MTRRRQKLVFAAVVLTGTVSASAQTTPSATTQPASPASTTETRPATTTYQGATGLWCVPTAEILPHSKFAVSAYRVNFDRQGGSSDISLWPITVAFGVKDRVEVFGSFSVQNRIDRDTRPLFSAGETGGV